MQDGARLVWLRARSDAVQPTPGALGRVRMIAPPDWVVVPTGALHGDEDALHVEVRGEAGSAPRDENALEVLTRIHTRMPQVRSALPDDVRVDVVYDRSTLVHGALRTVGMNLLEGGLLVTAVLLAFLGSFRAGIVAASVIPLSMVFATAVMSLLKLPGNLMSLGALDFGLLVDGAIVLVEGVFHGASSRPGGGSWTEHVRDVAGRAARPVFFSVLVIVLVYVPVLSMTGTDGKLFRPMALTVVLALLFALVLTLTWVPALLALWLRAGDVPARAPWLPSRFRRRSASSP